MGTVRKHPNVKHYDVALGLNVAVPMQRPHSSQEELRRGMKNGWTPALEEEMGPYTP